MNSGTIYNKKCIEFSQLTQEKRKKKNTNYENKKKKNKLFECIAYKCWFSFQL